MDETNNHEIILNKFNNLSYYEGSTIKDKILNNSHKEVRKLLNNYNIVKPWDTNRACGKSNYFDIAELKTNSIIRPNSKLVVTRPTSDPEKPVVYVYQNWQDKYQEIKEKILDRGYYEGFQSDSKKIKGWFEEENVLRFGTLKTDSVYVEFELANLNSLIKQKYYFVDKETAQQLHLSYQGQISALGVYFGFNSKLAKGEKNLSLYGINLNSVACLTMKDIDLINLIEGKSKEQVDLIDVIWTNKKGKIIVAFEVELKRVWKDVLLKFQALKLLCGDYGKDIYFVIVGNDPNMDYPVICEWVNSINFNRDFQDAKIKYLSVQKLIEILTKRDKQKSQYPLLEEFFSSDVLLEIKIDQRYM